MIQMKHIQIYKTKLVALIVEVLVQPCIEFGRVGPRGHIAMQCFAVWIAMQFVHASCLNLFIQFQRPVRRSRRGGSTSRTKGSADISPRGRQFKRVKSTRSGELTHGSEKNKQNRAKAKCHQATGSRSYVVQLQSFVSDGCVLLLLQPLYKQKLMCTVNRSNSGRSLRPPLERMIRKMQEQEKYRNMIGMHVKNRGMKNRGILLEGVFGFVQEKHRKPIQ